MDLLTNPDVWASLATLTILEIVLGIDNVIFIALLVQRLPVEQQARARTLGLGGALIMRVLLLFAIVWLTKLTKPLIELAGQTFSWRDIILIGGGVFLVVKATIEIHHSMEGHVDTPKLGAASAFGLIIAQIMALDIVFSLDSVLTAIGMAEHIEVMIAAVVIAIGVMLFAAGPISDFIQKHPTTKMLALSFLLMIGMALIADGFGVHLPRGYIYAAIGFSVMVEVLNLAMQKRRANRHPPHET
ncbi:TerC family protein [Emcibacter sp. SYSU 3D8]|uniref:TerC family protein n=1 Tax=Emcibacter sp. SYSU 3D8 TaxID=3133969 RepID=UPI0031FF3AD0